MQELLRLSRLSDHFHLTADGLGEVELRASPYRPTDKIIDTAKILFRPDELDANHFPHVL